MYFFTVALATLAAVAFAEEFQQEEGVYVLTKANFADYIDSHEFVLVEFYKPTCPLCIILAPRYAKAAQELENQGSEVTLAKVDCTVDKDLCYKSLVPSFPTLKFFKDGIPMDYGGYRSTYSIVRWVNEEASKGSDEETDTDSDMERDYAKANLKFDDGRAVHTGDLIEAEQTDPVE